MSRPARIGLQVPDPPDHRHPFDGERGDRGSAGGCGSRADYFLVLLASTIPPIIRVHTGTAAPSNAYTAVEYGKAWFWVDANDFNSKVAYTVLQLLIALVEGNTAGRAPVLTVPAG